MGFESLPEELEKSVHEFAKRERISDDEAVLRLIKAGLSAPRDEDTSDSGQTPQNAAEALIGLFSSAEGCAAMDEVVRLAYEGRRAAAAREANA
jgi:hypothetical protein